MSSEALEAHCIHAIGGGWGQETQDDKHTERVAVIRGTDIPRAAFGDISGIPLRWETPSKVKSRLLQAGDIVIEVSGGSAASGQHTGRALAVSADLLDRLGGRVIPASFCRLLRLDSTKVDPKFICYQIAGMHLTGDISEFENQSTGIANFQFTRFISDVSPALDELGDQREVAAILSALDDRITLLREINTTLEAIVQALFKSWFVDFDPVHAKMQGGVPEGMDEATAALFPDSFEESELGPAPKGWSVGLLSDLMQLHKGSINPLNHPEVLFSHFSLPAFDEGQMPRLEVGCEIKSNKTTVPPAAVLVSKLNPHIPRIWLPSAVDSNAVCSTEFLPFVPTSRTTTNFVYALLIEPSFMNSMTQLVTGTSNSHQRIKPDSVLFQKHVVPEEKTIRAFDGIVSTMMNRMKVTRQQIGSLASIRDTLLPRLISGQLQIEEVTEALS